MLRFLKFSSLVLFIAPWGWASSVGSPGNNVTVTNSASNPVQVTGSLSTSPSTSSVATGFLSGASTITVSASNPLPITGSLTTSPPAITTVSWQNQGAQNVISTNTQVSGLGGGALNVVSTNTSVSGTITANAGTGTFFNYTTNLTTVTFNNIGQPVTSTYTYVVNLTTITTNSIGIPTTSTSTYVTNLTTVTFNGIPQQTYTVNLTTITSNAIGIPTTSTSTYIVNLTTITSNAIAIPTTSTSTYVINLTTITHNGIAQPVFPVNITTVTFATTGGQPVTSTYTTVNSTASDNGVSSGTTRIPTLPGVYVNNYRNGQAGTQGFNAAAEIGTDGLLWTAQLPAMRPTSYAASTNTFTIASSTADFTAICGNAVNTVLVYGLRLSCTQTTAGNVSVEVVKRSSGYGVGWSTMTAAPQDSNYGVVQSTAIFMTINNVTNGTLLGHLDNQVIGCMAPATTVPTTFYSSPTDWTMKPIVLRGATQCVGVNVAGTAISGTKFTVTWEWIETQTITP